MQTQRPQLFKAKLIEKTQITPKVVQLKLSLIEPQNINFNPGKFINLRCPNGKYRAYSIASNPEDHSNITLIIENGHNGIASNYVNSLNLHNEVELIGPSGMFFLHTPLPSHLTFFATGTGIAPFISMFHTLVAEQYAGKIDLYFGVKKQDQIILPQILQNFKQKLKNFEYKIYVSQEQPEAPYIYGRITSELTHDLDKNSHYYICGNPAMVEEVATGLSASGINGAQIFAEGFTNSAKN